MLSIDPANAERRSRQKFGGIEIVQRASTMPTEIFMCINFLRMTQSILTERVRLQIASE
jgi:hypothetical protein